MKASVILHSLFFEIMIESTKELRNEYGWKKLNTDRIEIALKKSSMSENLLSKLSKNFTDFCWLLVAKHQRISYNFYNKYKNKLKCYKHYVVASSKYHNIDVEKFEQI